MASSFAKDALKICVAQLCQNIGWHAVQASPMDILVDVLQRYVFEIAKSVHQYSIQYNRTEPNLDDLALTFKDFGIVLQEIEEYVNNVESVPFAHKIAAFPVKHSPNLQHPKPESRELLVRPEHIPEYLPLMRPDLEEDGFNQQNDIDGVKKSSTESNTGGDSPSPFNSPKHGSRRSSEWAPDTPNKKPRYYSEEEGRPMREVTSVFMTAAGFISPVHEGKIAEASLPCLVDSPPPTPEYQSPSHSSIPSKKDSKSKDVKKDKSSKSKKDKESRKDVKKIKSKKEKENKDNNAVSKHEKAMTSTSTSVKKDHSSHKSNKSDKSSKFDDRQKLKSDKAKLKARKEELHKMKESLKLIKLKAKMKHTGTSSSLKSSKLSSSKKFKSARMPKPYKNFKNDKVEKVKSAQSSPVKSPPPVPVPVIPPEPPVEIKTPVIEPIIEKPPPQEEPMDLEEINFREESPESRLVIDDSLETQARQERESRLEVIDECIEAVIRRGEEESEVEAEKTHKAMDDTINSVIRGPTIKKLEPKDIYDFTDTSDESSLSSCDIPPHSPIHLPPKKEKKTSEGKKSESTKKNKNKDKQKKKGGKEPKVKSPSPYSPPKTQKPQFILKVEDRTPSPPPSLKDDLLSSDGSTPSSSPTHNTFLDHSPTRQGPMHPTSLLSHMPSPIASSFIPMPGTGPGYSTNPFTPMRPLPSHMQTHFPTPPLFVTPPKPESSASFQNLQPLNLAKSGPSSLKSSPEKSEASTKSDGSDLIKKAVNLIDKLPPIQTNGLSALETGIAKRNRLFESKSKDHKKERVKKKGKKELEKVKEKEEIKDKEKEKEKVKPKEKEKPKLKPEKPVKPAKKPWSRSEKKKPKDDKVKEDSSVPKITMKLSSGTGSTKILVKPNTKNSTPLSSSPSASDDEEEMLPTPSPPPHIPSPSPPREPTPPPPPTPSPPPPAKEEVITPPPIVPPPITKSTPSRGRGRGKKAAVQVVPPARTVITETVGTIVDESGNKIWICPACSGADDGSPMIGCDECDDWYHWVCVGIVVPPKEEENWFCVRCIPKRQTPAVKRRRKKHKKEK